jgi:hypothetical protein
VSACRRERERKRERERERERERQRGRERERERESRRVPVAPQGRLITVEMAADVLSFRNIRYTPNAGPNGLGDRYAGTPCVRTRAACMPSILLDKNRRDLG